MAVLGFQTNGDSGSSTIVTQEMIDKTIQGLDDAHQIVIDSLDVFSFNVAFSF